MLSTLCQDAKRKLSEGIANYNKALMAGDFRAMTAAEDVVKDAEAEYAQQAQLDLFSSHKDAECPVLEVLKEGFYGVVRHKPLREDGVLVGWEMVDAEKQVDIAKMFAYFQRKDSVWKIRCERLTEILVEWVCEGVGKSTSGVKDTFKMSNKAKEIEVGPKPTSNSSMLKLLQSCIDAIVTVEGEDGKNTVRANNRDLKFLQQCFAGEGKGRNNLKTMKVSGVIRVIGKAMYRIINYYAYDVDFKKIVEKNDDLEAQRAANRKAKEAKAEKAAEPETVVIPRPEDTAEDVA